MHPEARALEPRLDVVALSAHEGGRAFANALPLQVWTALPDGRLDWVNRRVLDYFGRTFDEMIGSGWQEFIHPDDLPGVIERWTDSLSTGRPYEVAFRLRAHDGQYRMHIGRALPTLDEQGRIVAWHGSNTDVDDRYAAREAITESERRAAFLANASRSLSTSLDYHETLRNIAHMAVPSFADWVAVDIVTDDGSIQRLAVAHVDPTRVAYVQRIEEQYPTDHSRPQGVGEVIRTGRSQWMREIPAWLLEESAIDERHLELIRALALRSAVIVPIRGKTGTRGAVTFVYAESARIYEERDVRFVEDLAARAAIALENAELVRDLVATRAQLEEQTAELEMQTEELQTQATHLEEQSTELEMSNAELEETLDRLTRSDALLAEAQSSAHLGSWEWDMIGGAITWTDEMYRLYGYAPQETAISFERYMAGIHPEDRDFAQQAIQNALESKGSFVFEHRAAGADGAERILHCRGRVILDESGRPIRMTGSAQDVTERRAAEEAIRRAHLEMERANRAKSDFLASMSHELRTPLNAIGGHVELIQIGIHGPVTEAQHASLERIRASQEHLLGLINDILQFAKVEAGRLEYRITDLAIDDVIVGVIGMLEPQAHARGLEVTQSCHSGVTVRADHDRLQQILINLVGNAIKFTDPGGSVHVECEAGSRCAVVRVVDTGHGIPESELESIFDPFVQVRTTRGDARQGVGLGLAISRDLARAMGGELTVTSRMGAGSTFTLIVPTA